MNLEIVEFYPLEINIEKGFLAGTLHVRLPDSGIHVLGIYVQKRLADTENPIKCVPKQEQSPRIPKPNNERVNRR